MFFFFLKKNLWLLNHFFFLYKYENMRMIGNIIRKYKKNMKKGYITIKEVPCKNDNKYKECVWGKVQRE